MGFFDKDTWAAPKTVHLSTLPKCGACGLYKNCTSPKIAPNGRGNRSILFVAESPGEQEDRTGKLLVGNSGIYLRKIMRELGVDLDDCFLTNCVICHPPGNDTQEIHLQSCRPTLLKTLRDLRPKVIVPIGQLPLKSVILDEWAEDVGPMGRWAGFTIPSRTWNAWVCPTFHPSYILRMKEDVVLARMFKAHLKRAIELESVPPAYLKKEELEKQVEVVTDVETGIQKMWELSKRSGVLAWDYEATGLKPEPREFKLLSASFCLDGAWTFATMLDERSHPALKAVLANGRLKKIASNLKYEERASIQKLGMKVEGWFWDTMLAAHVLDNREGIVGIKFQSYIRFGIGDYSRFAKGLMETKTANGQNRLGEATVMSPHRMMLLYNGLDSLLEYHTAIQQRKEMGLAAER